VCAISREIGAWAVTSAVNQPIVSI